MQPSRNVDFSSEKHCKKLPRKSRARRCKQFRIHLPFFAWNWQPLPQDFTWLWRMACTPVTCSSSLNCITSVPRPSFPGMRHSNDATTTSGQGQNSTQTGGVQVFCWLLQTPQKKWEGFYAKHPVFGHHGHFCWVFWRFI